MASNADRDHSMLNVGKQCTHRMCNLVDFLPFKCEHCGQSFCGDHFLPQAHECEKYDESKHNRVAPPCPFCQTPIAIPLGEDPNIRMERHFDNECSVLLGKTAKSSTPRCGRANCNKVLFSPIVCDKCKKSFCASHRFPADHKCVSSTTASTSASKSTLPSSATTQTPGSRPAAATAAAMAAIKRAVNTPASGIKKPQAQPSKPAAASVQAKLPATVPAPVSNKTVASSSSSSRPKPFPITATDRRAKAERDSRLKAMQARAKKGLLSEEEKVLLAAAEAEKASEKDCIIA